MLLHEAGCSRVSLRQGPATVVYKGPLRPHLPAWPLPGEVSWATVPAVARPAGWPAEGTLRTAANLFRQDACHLKARNIFIVAWEMAILFLMSSVLNGHLDEFKTQLLNKNRK